ncbi:polyprotein [Helianthus annuus alphaendornavirus]|uniref:Polyprotein n=1 Tax=Helianthus annuus alphaendornavirus TaxID=2184469 RepID=A0A2U8JGM0_9VIRU|nr:polyprotein [Helianthus annuus alphaendornavirus]AWK67841.1 polyprotein [Helianthus annuus alphaendornavirus]
MDILKKEPKPKGEPSSIQHAGDGPPSVLNVGEILANINKLVSARDRRRQTLRTKTRRLTENNEFNVKVDPHFQPKFVKCVAGSNKQSMKKSPHKWQHNVMVFNTINLGKRDPHEIANKLLAYGAPAKVKDCQCASCVSVDNQRSKVAINTQATLGMWSITKDPCALEGIDIIKYRPKAIHQLLSTEQEFRKTLWDFKLEKTLDEVVTGKDQFKAHMRRQFTKYLKKFSGYQGLITEALTQTTRCVPWAQVYDIRTGEPLANQFSHRKPTPEERTQMITCPHCKCTNSLIVPRDLKPKLVDLTDHRCGACGRPFQEQMHDPWAEIFDIFDESINPNVGAQTEMMKLMGRLDMSEIDEAYTLMDIAEKHDTRLVKSALSRLQLDLVDVPLNMEKSKLGVLDQLFGGFEFVPKPGLVTDTPLEDTFRNAVMTMVKKTTMSEGFYWPDAYQKPNSSRLNVVNPYQCCGSLECDHWIKKNTFITLESLSVGLNGILKMIERSGKEAWVCLPTEGYNPKADSGQFEGGETHYHLSGHVMKLTRPGHDYPMIVDKTDYENLTEGDIFHGSTGTYMATTILTGCGHKVRIIKKVDLNIGEIIPKLKPTKARPQTFKIPTVLPGSLGSITGILTSSVKEVTVEPTLLKSLMIKNLDASMTFAELLEFGMAFSFTRYHRGEKVISYQDLTSTQVIDHCVIALILTRRAMAARTMIVSATQKNSVMEVIQSAGLSVGMTTAVTLLEGITNTTIKSSLKTLMSRVDAISVNSLRVIGEHPVWDDIQRWTTKVTLSSYRIIDYRPLRATIRKEVTCPHVLSVIEQGDQQCLCCGRLARSDMCKDCSPCANKEHACSHTCVHDHKGEKKCLCCQLPSENKVCTCCKVHYSVADMVGQPTKKPTKKPEQPKRDSSSKQTKPEQKPGPKTREEEQGQYNDEDEVVIEAAEREDALIQQTSLDFVTALLSPEAWPTEATKNPPCGDIPMGSRILYVPMGLTIGESKSVKVTSHKVIPNKEGTCGLDALRLGMGEQVTISVMETVTKKTRGWDVDDLLKVGKALGKNVLVLTGTEVHVMKSNSEDDYHTIIHSTALNKEGQHWYPGTVQQVGVIRKEVVYNPTITMQTMHKIAQQVTRKKVNHYDVALMERKELIDLHVAAATVAETIKIHTVVDKNFRLETNQDEQYLVNNKEREHNIREGKICVIVPTYLLSVIRHLTRLSPDSISNDDVNTIFDKDDQIPETLNAWIKSEVADCVKTILYALCYDVIPKSTNPLRITYEKFDMIQDGTRTVLDVSRTKLKSLDVIYLHQDGKIVPTMINPKMGKIAITTDKSYRNKGMTIGIPQISIGSAIRNLASLLTMNTQSTYAMSKLEDSVMVLAPPGAGKTTEIMKLLTESSLVVASTGGALNSLRQKKPPCQVLSVEAGKNYDLQVDHLVIDECTTVGFLDYKAIVDKVKPKKVFAFGDTSQIGLKDMRISAGTRAIQGLNTYHKSIKKLNHTYRIGQPLSNVLSEVYNDLESKAEHKTDFEVIWSSHFDPETVYEKALKHNYDVILVHYRSHKAALLQQLNIIARGNTPLAQWARRVRVETIHSYQGQEADKVMVIQRSNQAGGSIEFDPQYNISAASRAKKHLTWYAVGVHSPNVDLGTILRPSKNIVGYGLFDMFSRFHTDTIQESVKQPRLKKRKGIGRQFLKTINNYLDRKYKATATLVETHDREVLKIKVSVITMAEVTISADGTIKEGLNRVGDLSQLIDLIHSNLEDKPTMTCSCNTISKIPSHKTMNQLEFNTCLRLCNLNWVACEMAMVGETLRLAVGDKLYDFVNPGECHVCSKTTIVHQETEIVRINRSHHFHTDVSIEYLIPEENLLVEHFDLMNNLGLDEQLITHERRPVDSPLLTRLANTELTINTYVLQMRKSIETTLKRTGNFIVDSLFGLKHETIDSETWCQSRGLTCLATIGNEMSRLVKVEVDNRIALMLPIEDSPIHYLEEEGKRDDNCKTMEEFIMEYINTLNTDGLLTKMISILGQMKVGGRDDLVNFEGLMVPYERHMARKDRVWHTVVNKLGKMYVESKRGEDSILYLSQTQIREQGRLIKQQFPHLAINEHRYMMDSDDYGSTLEQLINHVLLNDSVGKVDYVTYRPHLVILNSRINCRLVEPNHNRLLTARSKINETFMEGMCRNVEEAILTMASENEKDELVAITKQKLELAQKCIRQKQGNWHPSKTFSKDTDLICLGECGLSYEPSQLAQLVMENSGRRIIIWGPNPALAKLDQLEVEGQEYLNVVDKRTGGHYIIHSGIWDSMKYGLPIAQEEKTSVLLASYMTIGGLIVYDVKIKRPQDIELSWFAPLDSSKTTGLITIEVPHIHRDVVKLAKEGVPIISTRRIVADARLLSNLAKRMLRPTTFDELLNYARVLAHGKHYSLKGFTSVYEETPQELLDITMGVYLIYSRTIESMEGMTEGIISRRDQDLDTFKAVLTERVADFKTGLLGLVSKYTGLDLDLSDWLRILSSGSRDHLSVIRQMITTLKHTRARLLDDTRNIFPRPTVGSAPESKIEKKDYSNNPFRFLELAIDNVKALAKLTFDNTHGSFKTATKPAIDKVVPQRRIADSHPTSDYLNMIEKSAMLTYQKFQQLPEFDYGEAYKKKLMEFQEVLEHAKKVNGKPNRKIRPDNKLIRNITNLLEELEAEDWQDRAMEIVEEAYSVMVQVINCLQGEIKKSKAKKFKILMMTMGSSGDYKYFRNAALILNKAGAQTDYIVPHEGAKWFEEVGGKIYTCEYKVKEKLDNWDAARRWDLEALLSGMAEGTECLTTKRIQTEVFNNKYDMVIGTGITILGKTIAEYFACPYIELNAQPWFVQLYTHDETLAGKTKGLLDKMGKANVILANAKGIRDLRANLQMPEGDLASDALIDQPSIYCYEPCLSSDRMYESWPIVGYLGRSLIRKDQPECQKYDIVFTMGSMVSKNIPIHAETVMSYSKKHKLKTLILGGYSSDKIKPLHDKLSERDKELIHFEVYAEHEDVMTERTIVIHHGGCGTTNQALIGGCPQVIITVAFDQFYWAHKAKLCGISEHMDVDEPTDLLPGLITKLRSESYAQAAIMMKTRLVTGVAKNLIIGLRSLATQMDMLRTNPSTYEKITNLSPPLDQEIFSSKSLPQRPAITTQGPTFTDDVPNKSKYFKLQEEMKPLMKEWNFEITEPRRIHYTCCGSYGSIDVTLAENSDTLIVCNLENVRKPRFVYVAKEHTIIQPVLPFDTNRGPPSTATLAYHAHGEILHEQMKPYKATEIKTLAGQEQIISESKWLYYAAKNTRKVDTDYGNKRNGRGIDCRICYRRGWKAHPDLDICTCCFSKLEFPQIGNTADEETIKKYTILKEGGLNRQNQFQAGIGNALSLTTSVPQLSVGLYHGKSYGYSTKFNPQGPDGCVKKCIQAYVDLNTEATRPVMKNNRLTLIQDQPSIIVEEILKTFNMPSMTPLEHIEPYCHLLGLSTTLVIKGNVRVTVLPDAIGHIELLIIQTNKLLHCVLVTMNPAYLETLIRQETPRLSCTVQNSDSLTTCQICEQQTIDIKAGKGLRVSTQGKCHGLHAEWDRYLVACRRMIMGEMVDRGYWSDKTANHVKSVHQRITLEKITHVFRSMTEPVIFSPLSTGNDYIMIEKPQTIKPGQVMIANTEKGIIIGHTLQYKDRMMLVHNMGIVEPLSQAVINLRTTTLPRDYDPKDTDQGKEVTSYNLATRQTMEQIDYNLRYLPISLKGMKVILTDLRNRNHHNEIVAVNIEKARQFLVDQTMKPLEPEVIESLKYNGPIVLGLKNGRLEYQHNLVASGPVSGSIIADVEKHLTGLISIKPLEKIDKLKTINPNMFRCLGNEWTFEEYESELEKPEMGKDIKDIGELRDLLMQPGWKTRLRVDQLTPDNFPISLITRGAVIKNAMRVDPGVEVAYREHILQVLVCEEDNLLLKDKLLERDVDFKLQAAQDAIAEEKRRFESRPFKTIINSEETFETVRLLRKRNTVVETIQYQEYKQGLQAPVQEVDLTQDKRWEDMLSLRPPTNEVYVLTRPESTQMVRRLLEGKVTPQFDTVEGKVKLHVMAPNPTSEFIDLNLDYYMGTHKYQDNIEGLMESVIQMDDAGQLTSDMHKLVTVPSTLGHVKNLARLTGVPETPELAKLAAAILEANGRKGKTTSHRMVLEDLGEEELVQLLVPEDPVVIDKSIYSKIGGAVYKPASLVGFGLKDFQKEALTTRQFWNENETKGKYKLTETMTVEGYNKLHSNKPTIPVNVTSQGQHSTSTQTNITTQTTEKEILEKYATNEPIVVNQDTVTKYRSMKPNYVEPGCLETEYVKPRDITTDAHDSSVKEGEALGIINTNWMEEDKLLELLDSTTEDKSAGLWVEKVDMDHKLVAEDMNDKINVFTINFFEDNDMTDFNMMVAPTQGVLKSKETPCRVMETRKVTLTKRPTGSRPVFNKLANAEFMAVSRRLMSVVTMRKYQLDPKQEWDRFDRNYVSVMGKKLLRAYKEDQIYFNSEEIRKWISSRPDSVKIDRELEEMLSTGFEINAINTAKVHVKLESLLKEDYESVGNREIEHRIIVWQRKAWCAIFSPVFLQAKARLKAILSRKVLYADGLTQEELSSRVNLIHGDCWFMEDDLSKQDRQTDINLIQCEMYIYSQLGVADDVLNLWRRTHENWKFRGTNVSGILTGMRLTGQATTAVGNAIVNLLVHSRIFETNKNHIELMLLLGDDNLVISRNRIDSSKQSKISKDYYNMVSKASHDRDQGTFLQLLCYHNPQGVLEFGPDVIRLAQRYEVTNGVSESNNHNMLARTMSYCMLIGKTMGTKAVVTKHGLPIDLKTTCSMASARRACAIKRKMTLGEVESYESYLYRMMKDLKTHTWIFKHLA